MAFKVQFGDCFQDKETIFKDSYAEFSEEFKTISRDVNSLRLTQFQMNVVYKSMLKLIGAIEKLFKNVPTKHFSKATNYMCDEILPYTTQYRRDRLCKRSCNFVEPEEIAVGLKWKSDYDIQTDAVHHSLKQNTFHYISPFKLLQWLFKHSAFKNIILKSEHNCVPGVYERFCCAQIHQNLEFFVDNPKAIQLLFAIDDFEPCAALKSKTGLHKLCAVYMQVLNMPQKFLLKQKNTYLIALCCTSDLKLEFTSLSNIIELIVRDIKILEKEGIDVGDDNYLKGTIAVFTFDNLGGNSLFGFTEGFRASHYCRICDMSNEECSVAVRENGNKIRTIDDYNQTVAKLDNIRLHINGVKKPCMLNELENFHILRNRTVDLMHDILEGIAPKCIKKKFQYMINNKIMAKREIQERVRDHNYGKLLKDQKPSPLDLDKKGLNQNANQTYCLTVNLPFIFMDLKTKLSYVWILIESLLGIM